MSEDIEQKILSLYAFGNSAVKYLMDDIISPKNHQILFVWTHKTIDPSRIKNRTKGNINLSYLEGFDLMETTNRYLVTETGHMLLPA